MTARRMFLKFLIFGVVFMPFLSQAEANVAGMYGHQIPGTKYVCVYWENLFTLILQVEVLVSYRLSTFRHLKVTLVIKHQKTNLFQNLQRYLTNHYRVTLTTLEMPKHGRHTRLFPFFKQGNA